VADQWLFLSHMRRMSPRQVEALAESLAPVRVGPELAEPGAVVVAPPGERPAPERISCVLGAGISPCSSARAAGSTSPTTGQCSPRCRRACSSRPT
jgi:hypothetical protein